MILQKITLLYKFFFKFIILFNSARKEHGHSIKLSNYNKVLVKSKAGTFKQFLRNIYKNFVNLKKQLFFFSNKI